MFYDILDLVASLAAPADWPLSFTDSDFVALQTADCDCESRTVFPAARRRSPSNCNDQIRP